MSDGWIWLFAYPCSHLHCTSIPLSYVCNSFPITSWTWHPFLTRLFPALERISLFICVCISIVQGIPSYIHVGPTFIELHAKTANCKIFNPSKSTYICQFLLFNKGVAKLQVITKLLAILNLISHKNNVSNTCN